MKVALWRALLAPLTSLRAVLVRHRSPTPLSYDAAWRQARMLRHPDDMTYRLHGHHAEPAPDTRHNQPTNPSATDPA